MNPRQQRPGDGLAAFDFIRGGRDLRAEIACPAERIAAGGLIQRRLGLEAGQGGTGLGAQHGGRGQLIIGQQGECMTPPGDYGTQRALLPEDRNVKSAGHPEASDQIRADQL